MHTILCNRKCCTAKFCPLVPAWATTVHKFQGFEAGFDDNDAFRYLICDPGDTKWEQTCPGTLYTCISRAKTMGTFSESVKHPKDSAIYWRGCNISTKRITDGSLRMAKKKGDPKENCLLIEKREQWVNYLMSKSRDTIRTKYNESTCHELKEKRFDQDELQEGIADIITSPNETWLNLKRKQYMLEKTFFGNSL